MIIIVIRLTSDELKQKSNLAMKTSSDRQLIVSLGMHNIAHLPCQMIDSKGYYILSIFQFMSYTVPIIFYITMDFFHNINFSTFYLMMPYVRTLFIVENSN